MRTWTNAKGTARIDGTQYVGRYNLSHWPADPLRSPTMRTRYDCNMAQALRFAQKYGVQSFLDATR